MAKRGEFEKPERPAPMSDRVIVRVTADQRAHLEAIARRRSSTMTDVVRQALNYALANDPSLKPRRRRR